ncbi:leucine-rich repeat-containing protein [Tanacetum coccineum]
MLNWNTSTDCCNWNGVTCDRSTGDVIGIDLSCGMLRGTIHPNSSLFNLPHLQTLNLAFNDFSGSPIPSEIGMFSNSLTHLNLSRCGLSGQVPPEITLLHKLVSLDLSFYVTSENFKLEPHVFINLLRNFTNLEELSLEGVGISSVLPTSLNISSSLKLLNLQLTRLQGKLPHCIFNLQSLETLDLRFNHFTGNIPSCVSVNLSLIIIFGCVELYLASCKLKVFPESFRAMKQLWSLDLSDNEIHGQIPHWAGEIGRNELGLLNLSHNFITVLPQFQWYGLRELYLQSNLIEGPFPPSICNMSHLAFLDLSHNRFDGVIPQCVGNIDYIHNVFGRLIRLQGLILNGNRLEGGVPSSLSKCEILTVLDLGNNHLNGTFPGWLEELRFLQVLILKSNNFHGNIQPSFAVKSPFQGLHVLDLSHNGFVGQLPTKYFQNFNSMKNVVKDNTEPQYLYMGGKYYSFVVAMKGVYQDIPRLFVSLTIIDLSNNYFKRGIPEIIGNLSALKVLNLSHNCLNGRIPDSLGKLSEIESLDLSWNKLTGNIPQSLAGIKGLEVLNLSQNHLVGHIPEGTQFKTFDESSFAGNLGLCGFPLPKECSERTHKPQLEEHENHEDRSGFTWEVVTLGYGCGTLIGLVMGYLMLSTRKVKWFNLIADAGEHMILERNKRRYEINVFQVHLNLYKQRQHSTTILFENKDEQDEKAGADMDFGDIDFSLSTTSV